MIYPIITNESILQVDDKTRIDASKSFANNGDTIDLIEIDPTNSGTFYDVTEDQHLDWVYTVDGEFTIALRLNGTETKTSTISVITKAQDNLFSKDSDIIPYEPDILKWVQDGRSTFLDKHRTAQIEILNDLDTDGIWKRDGSRYTAVDIIDIQDFKEWSKFVTLRIIFESLSNEIGDIFARKAEKYIQFAIKAKSRAVLRLSPDGIEDTVKVGIFSGDLVRS